MKIHIRFMPIFLLTVAAGVGFYLYRRHQQALADEAAAAENADGTDAMMETDPEDMSAGDQTSNDILGESSDLQAPVESGILSPVGPAPGQTVFLPPTATSMSGGGPPTVTVNVHRPKKPKKPKRNRGSAQHHEHTPGGAVGPQQRRPKRM